MTTLIAQSRLRTAVRELERLKVINERLLADNNYFIVRFTTGQVNETDFIQGFILRHREYVKSKTNLFNKRAELQALIQAAILELQILPPTN